MFSTITIEPSTIIPKSTAPMESRFAGIFPTSMKMNAMSSDSGMVIATMNAARAFPRNRNKMTVTSRMPSIRLCITVCVVRCISSVRS